MYPVERILAFTTLLLSAGVAHASHPKQPVRPEGTAADFQFVATQPMQNGRVFARQVLPAQTSASTSRVVQGRVIYLNHEGVELRPGVNDAMAQTSSVVTEPTAITAWDVDDEMWGDTLACVREIYAPFDIEITDVDPGATPHLEAVFGGHPSDVGLPDNVAGVSPFTNDCGIIENSVVFTFTDVIPDDPRLMCEIMSQEIAHSFGLDHEMLPSDPMTYLDYAGERTFQDEAAPCGEFTARRCGINGNTCRQQQNSVTLLTQRLGARNGAAGGTKDQENTTPGAGVAGGGCAAGGGGQEILAALALAVLPFRRRRDARHRRPRRGP